MIQSLTPDLLYRSCPDDIFTSSPSTTSLLPHELIDQQRAQEALKMGLTIQSDGFNVFVSGEEGTGKLTAVRSFLEKITQTAPTPKDWCYVYNFKDSYHPNSIALPAGKGNELKKDMKDFIADCIQVLMKVFESEEYANRRQQIKDQFDRKQAELSFTINQKAAAESLVIKQTPWEIFTVPLVDGQPMSDEHFDNLPVTEKKVLQETQTRFTNAMTGIIKQQRQLEKELMTEYKKLESEVATFSVKELIEEMANKYADLQEVIHYLNEVQEDLLQNLGDFMMAYKERMETSIGRENDFLKRYSINVVVDNSSTKGAPIVIEANPTYNNLIGTVEKESIMGSLITDFTMIRKGSLHVANGGYLIIRASELFKNYFSWEALKRSLRTKHITIEEVAEQLGYLSTKSLKPDPIPLTVKVVLVGNPIYYHLLYEYDLDFKSLFKIKAEFNSDMERTKENMINFVIFFRELSKKEGLLESDTDTLKRLVEYGSRCTEDQNKISTRLGLVADVLREANHYALQEKSATIRSTDVVNAIEKKLYRSNLIAERINDMICNKHILMDIRGKKVGQVNALSIIDMGDILIGKPNRITCTVNIGKEGVITIEREAEMSGPIHTKGVMILSGYLADKFFQDKPVSLSARLVFEQSYSEIEGDSASSTELYALLSALSKIPIKQGIAVTGSVNQKGEIQPIGGVNEKIEGYFEVCKLLGLDGEQGVLLPASNVQNLMLKQEVVQAVKEGKFHIWSVETIEEGITILTGMEAGSADEEESLFHLVDTALNEYADRIKEFAEDEA
jgi:lon-related putative ATP-dependent protease